MEWKKIAKVFLRILWMMAPPWSVEGLKGSKVQRVRKVVSPNRKEEATNERNPLNLSEQFRTLQNPQPRSKSECAATAVASVGATYSSNCSRLLPRSQVLYSLQWDCHHSTRKIDLLVLHCSDTRPDQDFTIEKLMRSHRNKGYGAYPGYHIYVRRDGTLFYCRPVAERGCHVKGYNTNSIGICYEGGHSCSPDVKYEDNRTAEQMVALDEVLRILHEIYPEARIVGHCELNPHKACPCLDPPASVEYQYIINA